MNEITTHIEGKPLAIALPTEWLEEYQDNTQLRDAAAASLKSSKNDNPLVVSSEDVTLACLQESRVLERILGGASKRVVARELNISTKTVERICYSPRGREQLSACVNRMNDSAAKSLELLMEQSFGQLSDMLVDGNMDTKLKCIDRVIGLYVKLNKISECSIPRVSQTRTTKSDDGTVDKMTVTQTVVS
jgi:hypothetical protein